ncbi:hypothetical protein KKG41_04135 [Patescibacteria group bacterium]|nr:hypothetical protein [Patescibacteria group bacterium]MBU1891145.1 hypothetical protein [Patescibacteria group bacterium]
MPKKKKIIELVYTRDLSLFTIDLWYWLVTEAMKNEIGFCLQDQIVHYTSRTTESYRLEEDLVRFKNYILNLPVNHYLFSQRHHKYFRTIAKEIRQLISIKKIDLKLSPNPIQEVVQRWEKIWGSFIIAFLLPSAWADDLKKKKNAAAMPIINEYYKNRMAVEGLFENQDMLARAYAGKLLKKYKIPTKYSHLVHFTEFMDMLNSEIKLSLDEFKARNMGYVSAGGKLYVTEPFEKVLGRLGYEKQKQIIDSKIKILKGTIAQSGGVIRGKVCTLFNIQEVSKFPKGAILVSPETSPVFLPAMKKAKAIITDEGGITSHAAIVSRELKIPCMVGTKVATKVLKDNDIIKVDFKKGIIEKL